jgi:hypothetical protein
MVAPQQILAEIRRTPFQPFRLVLADGAKYTICHPDQCMPLKKSLVIGEVADRDGFVEWTININYWNVLRIEKEEAPAVASA